MIYVPFTPAQSIVQHHHHQFDLSAKKKYWINKSLSTLLEVVLDCIGLQENLMGAAKCIVTMKKMDNYFHRQLYNKQQ